MPKVTIVFTSYNHGKYIREAIDSVLNQTFKDFELVILDDASSDNSWDVISQYSDPRIKAIRNPVNIGPSIGVNRTIAEANPKNYIAMQHSDDVWERDKLEKEVAFLDAHPEVGAVFSDVQAIGEDGVPLGDKDHFYSNVFRQPNKSRYGWLRHFFFYGNALCHPSAMVRRECYASCGSYSDVLPQLGDFDMWVRLCLKYEIHVLPERLVRFRVRENEANTSGNRPEVRIRTRSEFHHILKHYLRIDSFDELAAIFPEAEKYRRADGCVPQFILSMMALSEASLPWGKMLGIETLFELMTDEKTKQRIAELYQFSSRDFTALTGKHDLFYLESIVQLGAGISNRDALISAQAEQIRQITQLLENSIASGQQAHVSAKSPVQPELSQDRAAYEQASRLLESGQTQAGKARLEELAGKRSTCWDVYNDLAVQYFSEGDLARAAPLFEKGMMLEGRAGTTARNYASMLLTSGNVEGALAALGEVLRERPGDVAALSFIRDVLSNINPIPPQAWSRLVADIRAGVGRG